MTLRQRASEAYAVEAHAERERTRPECDDIREVFAAALETVGIDIDDVTEIRSFKGFQPRFAALVEDVWIGFDPRTRGLFLEVDRDWKPVKNLADIGRFLARG